MVVRQKPPATASGSDVRLPTTDYRLLTTDPVDFAEN